MITSLEIPTSCLTQIWMTTPPGDYEPGPVLGNPYDTACFPVARGSSLSPALCPQGYHSACTPKSLTIEGETVMDCCPNGYFCDGGFFSCSSHSSANFTVTMTDVDGPDQSLVLKTTVVNGMNAHSIRVRYATTDLFVTTTVSPDATETDAAVPSSATTLPAATSSGEADTEAGGLSTGAKAGIGVGAAVGGLALLGFIFFLFRRSRRQTPRTELEDTTYHPMSGAPPVVPQKSPGPSEMGHKEPSELNVPPNQVYHEMEGNLHEVDGGRYELR
ncbi:hypothetical protein PFICI_00926 [Pestalotiopsis fici W106-1]|uniref:Uncharacterized protein n=1 Tax=Pestalotiopsis fici (strain W106-1 / CGMCC3.15140) TaxID=1229662 RepID=W3XM14_PESFW|nr:uncharacterized protein PFICI_00926 [Pestalotiopsis fici W106-1]ETS87098.1 hypothetical protein PFICI_00926 [Pestalotiopsis fici W106-1]